MNKIKIVEVFAQNIYFTKSRFQKKNAVLHCTNKGLMSFMLHSLTLTSTHEEAARVHSRSISFFTTVGKRFSLCTGAKEDFIYIIK